MLYVGIATMIIGDLIFLLPFMVNKWEVLIKVGFVVLNIGGILSIVGAYLETMARYGL